MKRKKLSSNFDKIYGEEPINIKKSSNEKRRVVKIRTTLKGGIEKAQELFEEKTKRKLEIRNGQDGDITDEIMINFYEKGKYDHPALQVWDRKKKLMNK